MRDQIAELWPDHSVKEIGEIMGIPHEKINAHVKVMRSRHGYTLVSKKRKGVTLTREEVIDLVTRYPTEAEYLNNKANLPPINVVRRFFGSWTNARIEAGLGESKGRWKKDDILSVYVVHFLEEDFYKFGVTKKTIQQRFACYPEFEVVYETILPLEQALTLEKIFKEQAFYEYRKYVPQADVFHGGPSRHGGGAHECFRTF